MVKNNSPTLIPAVMDAPKYGTNYRQSAVIAAQKDAEAQQSMLSGKPLTSNHLVSENGKNVAEKNSSGKGTVIPTIETGVKPSPMANSALTGSANTSLQMQENSKYDEFDPSKPVSSDGAEIKNKKKKSIEGFALLNNPNKLKISELYDLEGKRDHFKIFNIYIKTDIIAILAILVGIISFIPILFRMHRTRDSDNFTWINILIALLSNGLWLTYGYVSKSYISILSGILYTIIYSYISFIKYRN